MPRGQITVGMEIIDKTIVCYEYMNFPFMDNRFVYNEILETAKSL